MMEDIRKNERLSAWGLNCCLCPRYYTNGISRCSGCGCNNFKECREKCSVISCCLNNGFEYCYECKDYPCDKYKNAYKDSFITHQNIFKNFEIVKKNGIKNYMAVLDEKEKIVKIIYLFETKAKNKNIVLKLNKGRV